MTQKSLVYMVLAVAVGYMLVSAVPQQLAMYTTPPEMLSVSEKSFDTESAPLLDDGEDIQKFGDTPSDLASTEIQRGFDEPSFLETSRLPELMKWWIVDIMVALSIYWVARRRLV